MARDRTKNKKPDAPQDTEVMRSSPVDPPEPDSLEEAVVDEDTVEEEEVEESQEEIEESPRLAFKNIVRSLKTRLHRAVTPGRHRFKQYVGGARILRGQQVVLRQDQILADAQSLLLRVENGILDPIIPDGPERGRILSPDEFYDLLVEWSEEPFEASEAATSMPDCDPGPQATTARREKVKEQGKKRSKTKKSSPDKEE